MLRGWQGLPREGAMGMSRMRVCALTSCRTAAGHVLAGGVTCEDTQGAAAARGRGRILEHGGTGRAGPRVRACTHVCSREDFSPEGCAEKQQHAPDVGKGPFLLFGATVQGEAGTPAPSPQRTRLPSALPRAQDEQGCRIWGSVLHHQLQQSHGACQQCPLRLAKGGWEMLGCAGPTGALSFSMDLRQMGISMCHIATATGSIQRGETARQGRDHMPAAPCIPHPTQGISLAAERKQ